MRWKAKYGTVSAVSRPPNLLWILTTQWRAQACGYAGDTNVRTPHLDAFAGAVANFAQAVTPHPFGPFARAALLTGRPSPENGVRDYFDPLPAETRTVAHALRERGYATAFFGKWHLAPRDRHAPLVGDAYARALVPPEYRGGFEFWEGFEGGFVLNDPWLHGTRLPTPTRFMGYQSDVVCERAATWQRGRGGAVAPWFCVASVEPPHPPYTASSAGCEPPLAAELELAPNVPRGGDVEQKARTELAGYYAHIAATDRAIGRLLATIDRANTAVVVTSVHGDMHGAHGLFRKGWPYEESVRVPLLVHLPPELARDGAEPGRHDAPVSLLDLSAWATRWADGIAGVVTPARQVISMPSVVALPHQCDRIWRGVRTPKRKLVLAEELASGGESLSPWLFFDLERDPWEQTNLVNDPGRAGELAGLRKQIDG